MTLHYNSHSEASSMHDLIDKHVRRSASPMLADFYANAEKTRQHLKDIGAWPESKNAIRPPAGKRSVQPITVRAAEAYAWGIANNATTIETAKRFNLSPNSLHSFIQYRKLPRLGRTNKCK